LNSRFQRQIRNFNSGGSQRFMDDCRW